MKRRLEKGPLIPPSSVLQSEVAKKLPNRMSKWDHCQKTFKDELSSIVDVTDLPLSRWDKYIEEDNYDFEPSIRYKIQSCSDDEEEDSIDKKLKRKAGILGI